MSDEVKIIAAVVLIVIGAHLLLYGFIRRKVALAKAEGYRRQREAEGGGMGDATTRAGMGEGAENHGDDTV